jgi:hypothetical protein
VQQLQLLRPYLNAQVRHARHIAPGRLRLATSPTSTGSLPVKNTIGIVAFTGAASAVLSTLISILIDKGLPSRCGLRTSS